MYRNSYQSDKTNKKNEPIGKINVIGDKLDNNSGNIEPTRNKDVYKPIWKQEVKDENGRKRFHGAFTGGFSSGYFNTVGSKEGFTPATFKSSKIDKSQQIQNLQPKDYMDEEDLNEFAVKELSKQQIGLNLFDSVLDDKNKQDNDLLGPNLIKDIFGESPIPSESVKESIGLKLLKLMMVNKSDRYVSDTLKKRKQQDINIDKKKNVKKLKTNSSENDMPIEIPLDMLNDGVELSQSQLNEIFIKQKEKLLEKLKKEAEEDEEEEDDELYDNFNNRSLILNEKLVSIQAKKDMYGIGYIPSNDIKMMKGTNQQQAQGNTIGFGNKSNKSLWLGALEDDDDNEGFDIYGDSSSKDTYDSKFPKKRLANQQVIDFIKPNEQPKRIYRCQDGTLPLKGFILSNKPMESKLSKSYPLPKVPIDFQPNKCHSFQIQLSNSTLNRTSHLLTPITPVSRSNLLNEHILPSTTHNNNQPIQNPPNTQTQKEQENLLKNIQSSLHNRFVSQGSTEITKKPTKTKQYNVVKWFPESIVCKRFDLKVPYTTEEYETHQNDKRQTHLSKFDWKSKLNIKSDTTDKNSTSITNTDKINNTNVQQLDLQQQKDKIKEKILEELELSEILNTTYTVPNIVKPSIDLFKAIFENETDKKEEPKIVDLENEEEEYLDPFSMFLKENEKLKDNNNNNVDTNNNKPIINSNLKTTTTTTTTSTQQPHLNVIDYSFDPNEPIVNTDPNHYKHHYHRESNTLTNSNIKDDMNHQHYRHRYHHHNMDDKDHHRYHQHNMDDKDHRYHHHHHETDIVKDGKDYHHYHHHYYHHNISVDEKDSDKLKRKLEKKLLKRKYKKEKKEKKRKERKEKKKDKEKDKEKEKDKWVENIKSYLSQFSDVESSSDSDSSYEEKKKKRKKEKWIKKKYHAEKNGK